MVVGFHFMNFAILRAKARLTLPPVEPKEENMHTPSDGAFWLSVALVLLAILSTFVHIPYITMYALWVAVIGYDILLIGVRTKTL